MKRRFTQPLMALLGVTAALLMVASTATAQQERGPRGDREGHRGPPDAETRVAKMTRMLDLSDEQSAQLLVIMQDVDQERQILHDKTMELMAPEICDLQLRTESEIAGILTEEQWALMEEKKAARAEKGKRRGHRGMDDLDCSAYE